MKEHESFIKLSWLALVAIARVVTSLATAVMIPLLLYMMWTGQDIKNIHVALIVLCAAWFVDSPVKPKPKGRGEEK